MHLVEQEKKRKKRKEEKKKKKKSGAWLRWHNVSRKHEKLIFQNFRENICYPAP
jgi:hypothetical protein